jgi:hypothetical protein
MSRRPFQSSACGVNHVTQALRLVAIAALACSVLIGIVLAPKFKMYLVSRLPIELHIRGGNSVAEHLRLYTLHDYFSNIDLKRYICLSKLLIAIAVRIILIHVKI